jgi:hypothetical protein
LRSWIEDIGIDSVGDHVELGGRRLRIKAAEVGLLRRANRQDGIGRVKNSHLTLIPQRGAFAYRLALFSIQATQRQHRMYVSRRVTDTESPYYLARNPVMAVKRHEVQPARHASLLKSGGQLVYAKTYRRGRYLFRRPDRQAVD